MTLILCLLEDGGPKDLYQEDKLAVCLIRIQCAVEDCKIKYSLRRAEINILTLDIRFRTKDLLL